MNYGKFFKILSWELKQSGKEDKDSSFEYINKDDAKYYTNESIRELVELNPRPFEREEDFQFQEKTERFDLPKMYNSASNYKYNDLWYKISDSSDRLARVISISDRTLVFNPPLEPEEKIRLLVVRYPDEIVEDEDAVDFPEQYLLLLRLYIQLKVTGRKGREMSGQTLAIYQQQMTKWLNYCKTVKNSSFMEFRGYGFGR